MRRLLLCAALSAALSAAAHGAASQPQRVPSLQNATPDSILAMLQPDFTKRVADEGHIDDAAMQIYVELFGPFILLPYLPDSVSSGQVTRADGSTSPMVTRDSVNQSGQSKTLLAEALGYLNLVAYALAAVIILATMMSSTIATASEGVPLGKRFSTVWLPLRNGVALALLAPVPGIGGGVFSLVQVALVWMLMMGSTAGTAVWQNVLDRVMDGSSISVGSGLTEGLETSMKTVALSMACARAVEGMGKEILLVGIDQQKTDERGTGIKPGSVKRSKLHGDDDGSTYLTDAEFAPKGPLVNSLSRRFSSRSEIRFFDVDCGSLTWQDRRQGDWNVQNGEKPPDIKAQNAIYAGQQYDANWSKRFLWKAAEKANKALVEKVPKMYEEVVKPIFALAEHDTVKAWLAEADGAMSDGVKYGHMLWLYEGKDSTLRDDDADVVAKAEAAKAVIKDVLDDTVRTNFHNLIAQRREAGGNNTSYVAQAESVVQDCLRQAMPDLSNAGEEYCGAVQANWKAGLDLRGWATAGAFFFELSRIPRLMQEAMGYFTFQTQGPGGLATREGAERHCREMAEEMSVTAAIKALLPSWASSFVDSDEEEFWKLYCGNKRRNDLVGAVGLLSAALKGYGDATSTVDTSGEQNPADMAWGMRVMSPLAEGVMNTDSASLGGGIDFDFSQASLPEQGAAQANPFIVLAEVGETALATSAGVFTLATLASIGEEHARGVPGNFLAALYVVLEYLSALLGAMAAALWGAGITLAYLVPLLPLITWVFLIASYALMTIECIAAAPLGVVMMCTPEGEGISGTKMQTMIQIIAAAMLSPILLVIGLLASLALSYVVFAFFHNIYWTFVRALLDTATGPAGFDFLIYFVLYVGLCFQICKWCVSVMPKLPNAILAWFATGAGQRLGDFQGADGSSQGILASAGSTIGQAATGTLQDRRKRKNEADANDKPPSK